MPTVTTKRRALRAAPRKTPSPHPFLSIPDEELVRHSDLAYEDGYADGRDFGKDGFFLIEDWCTDARERYLQGFAAGCRVHKLIWG